MSTAELPVNGDMSYTTGRIQNTKSSAEASYSSSYEILHECLVHILNICGYKAMQFFCQIAQHSSFKSVIDLNTV